MALYGQHVKQVSAHHPTLESRGPSVKDKPLCLYICGQRAVSSLSVTLQAICRSTRLSPCLCLPPCLERLLLSGAQPPLVPWGTEAAERKRAWRRKRKEHVSSIQGAEPRSTDRALELSKGPVGREGWQTALCECCTGHIHGNKEREASEPSRASRAGCSFPVCSLFQT